MAKLLLSETIFKADMPSQRQTVSRTMKTDLKKPVFTKLRLKDCIKIKVTERPMLNKTTMTLPPKFDELLKAIETMPRSNMPEHLMKRYM